MIVRVIEQQPFSRAVSFSEGASEKAFQTALEIFKETVPKLYRHFSESLQMWLVMESGFPQLELWCAAVSEQLGATVIREDFDALPPERMDKLGAAIVANLMPGRTKRGSGRRKAKR